MALDGIYLSYLAAEISSALEEARVDKICQPEKDEIDIIFRKRSGAQKLLISSNPNSPRIHLTNTGKENPMSPPMFCMLLRKHLTGARFSGIRQPGFERILFVDFLSRNELGDEVTITIAAEIMGRYSNIILLDKDGRIFDSVKHVDMTMSRERQVMPGIQYELPPKQDKLNLPETPPDAVCARIRNGRDCELQKALLKTVQGVSPVVCRELAWRLAGDAGVRTAALTADDYARLSGIIENLRDNAANKRGVPFMILDAGTKKPMDFSFMTVKQYGGAVDTAGYDTFSELLDAFYTKRDAAERMKQRSHGIVSIVNSHLGRARRKLASQSEELEQSRDREELRVCGDLISANMHKLKKGMDSCIVGNFYKEGEPEVSVKLDPALSPSANAQKYYNEYRKASAAEKYLKQQIALGKEEISYLETVIDELTRAKNEDGLNEIRQELVEQGYLKNRGGKNSSKHMKPGRPMHFKSGDGFDIFVGRNNRQNDRLTLKTAAKNDVWLHTRNIPGAHVIIAADGMRVPDSTLTQAAVIAAFHSKAKDSAQVPVDYTLARYVKKPGGAKPGKVIYENFKTAFVNPNENIVEQLKTE